MGNKYKIAITDYTFRDLKIEERVLSEIPDIELIQGKAKTEKEVIELAKDADGVINQYAPMNSNVLEHLSKCKVISCYGVGVNTVDVAKATEKGIYVTNVPDYCMDEVSDHALTLLLSWARKVVSLNSYVKSNIWDFKKGIPIHRFSTQTVGVLGFGRIPRKLTKKLVSIGFQVIVYDPYVDVREIKKFNAKPATLKEVFEYSDFISVHIPLTTETQGLIGRDLFQNAKKSPVIINTSRGTIINEIDLIEALQSNLIGGAALDVTEKEPITPDNPLLKMDNVILTPHVAWYSEESEKELREKCAQNVVQVLQKDLPTYLVNKDIKLNR